MADPAPVAQTFFVDDKIFKSFRLDGIITLVDAKHVEQHLDDVKPDGIINEAVQQLAFADRVLLNKTDLVSESDLERVEARIKAINQFAPIKRSCQSQVSVNHVLNVGGFDVKRTLTMDPDFFDTSVERKHDENVGSLSLQVEGNIFLDEVQTWMGAILNEKGADIFRMKGVLSIAYADLKFVYHGVHMLFNGNFDEEWAPDEPRKSQLVFIGKNLNHEELQQGLDKCRATPERLAEKTAALRFKVGDRVECRVSPKEWAKGVVVDLMWRDDNFSQGVVAPYQVELSASGKLIYAPQDHPQVIREARD